MDAAPKSLRTAFLGETAAAIIEKAEAAGPASLTADERAFRTVWYAEAALSNGGVDLAARDASPAEIAAAYEAIGSPRKAAVFVELGRLRPGARDPTLDEAFHHADEDPDRLLEKFWFARSPEARAELRRRSADLPGLLWKLVCWTASGWLIGCLVFQGSIDPACCSLWFVTVPFGFLAWLTWGIACARSALQQAGYAPAARQRVIVLMVVGSVVLQILLAGIATGWIPGRR